MFGEFNNFIIHCILSAVENVNFGDFCQYFQLPSLLLMESSRAWIIFLAQNVHNSL